MSGPAQFNLAAVNEAVEAAVPDRPCVIRGERTLTYREFGDRTRQLANALLADGLGTVRPRTSLDAHESGQDHLGIYMHNSIEYLEAMVGAYKARVVPFNVNYRYVADELAYLLADSNASAIVYHSEFAPVLAEALGETPNLKLLIQVPDASGTPLLPGAIWYDEALSGQDVRLEESLPTSWSPDDLYMLYTGGSTGSPKGVIWRQGDIFVAAMGGRRLDSGETWSSLDEIARHALDGGARLLPASPFMHGAAQWLAFSAFTNGNTIVIPQQSRAFDAIDALDTIERHGVELLLIIGDAFGRPLAEELERGDFGVGSLLVILSGGATLSAGMKQRLVDAVPTAMVLDGLGASETGTQASQLTAPGQIATSGRFRPNSGSAIISADRSRLLDAPGRPATGAPMESTEELGWLAQSGNIPLGYLNDPERTHSTFITVGDERYALPGDRAVMVDDGLIELRGRESSVINTGGEKVFAEEVEQAMLSHPSVRDCLVTARPSRRWGEEVVALVESSPGHRWCSDAVLAHASEMIARYKLPKEIILVDHVHRSPAGKPDYNWARRAAAGAASEGSDTRS